MTSFQQADDPRLLFRHQPTERLPAHCGLSFARVRVKKAGIVADAPRSLFCLDTIS